MIRPNRPSHFMFLLLCCVGVVLVVFGEDLVPAPGPRARARIAARGHAQLLARGVTGSGGELEARDRRPEGMQESPAGDWTLYGSVLGESADLAAGWRSRVALELVPLADEEGAALPLPRSKRCAPDGSYEWSGLPAGPYRLRALPATSDSPALAIAIDLRLPEVDAADERRGAALGGGEASSRGGEEGRRYRQDLELPRPRILEGRVVDRRESKRSPLRVSVVETGLERGSSGCDAEGSFVIPRVGHGPYAFEVRDENGAAVSVSSVKTGEATAQGKVRVALMVP